MAYNEKEHPREAGTGRWKNKNDGHPGSLPAQSEEERQALEYVNNMCASLDSGNYLTDSEKVTLSISNSQALIQAAYEANRPEIDWPLAGNSALPEEQLEELIDRQPDQSWDRHIRANICLRRNMSENLQSECEQWSQTSSGLPSDTRKAIVINLVQNPGTDSARIRRLLDRYKGQEVSSWAIRNPSCDDDTLNMLVNRLDGDSHEAQNDMTTIARNPGAGPKTLHSIMDRSRQCDEYVYANPNLDQQTLNAWNKRVESYSAETRYPIPYAAIGAAANPRISESEAIRLNDCKDKAVKRNLAQNPATPQRILEEYANQGEYDSELSRNPNIDDSIGQSLYEKNRQDVRVQKALMRNPGLSTHLRYAAYQQARTFYPNAANWSEEEFAQRIGGSK